MAYNAAMPITLSVDPAAFTLAFLAIALSLWQLRRTYKVIVGIADAAAGGTHSDENRGQMFTTLNIHILNKGRPLHDVQVTLEFRPYGMAGSSRIPLKFYPPDNSIPAVYRKGEFGQGMIGNFGFKSYQLEANEAKLLGSIRDAAEQGLQLVIYSQGYRAAVFNVDTGMDLIKGRWREFAQRVNLTFDTRTSIKGSKARFNKPGKLLPIFPSLGFAIKMFVRGRNEGDGNIELIRLRVFIDIPRFLVFLKRFFADPARRCFI